MAVMAVDADAPVAVKERLEAFAGEVLAAAMNRPVQRVTAACICAVLWSRVLASRLSRSSGGWAGTLTISRCSSSWPIARGIRRWS